MFSVTAIGTIGRLELKTLNAGMAIAEGSIASNRQVKGEKHTDWLNFKAFGKTAETLGSFVKIGDQAIFAGSIQTESWEKDGQKQSKTIMVVERFEFGKNKRDGGEQATTSPKFTQGFLQKETTFEQHQPGAFDDVPF